MNMKKTVPILAVVVVGIILAWMIIAMDRGSHGKPTEEEAKGPHGGRWLSEGDFQVEVTIYERGVPPQFRVYPFEKEKPVNPSEVRLTIELHRLGGRVDTFRFKKEEDYLVGDKVVEEPHSFDVKVVADQKGRSYQWEYSQVEGRVELSPEAVKGSGIVVETVGPVRMKSILELPGTIRLNADKVVHVVPRLTGVVTEVRKNLGDKVRKGEVIAAMDSRELADAKREYIESVRRLDFARIAFNREKALWKKKISSEEDYLVKRYALEEAQITHQATAQKLRALGLSKSDLAALTHDPERNFARYELKAAFDGVVIEKHVSVGGAVKEDDTIFVLADLSTVWVDVTVYTKDLNVVRVGQKVTVKSDVLGTNVEGRLTYLGPLIGEQTRTAKGRVVISNPQGAWRPGLFVTVYLIQKEFTIPLAVKASALQKFRGWDVVFIQVGNLFEARPLQLGRRASNWVEVLSGLSAGEKYVSQNSFILKADVLKSGATHDH